MKKYLVCKTRVAFGREPVTFALFTPDEESIAFQSLEDLARHLRGAGRVKFLKNDAPADILHDRQKPSGFRATEYERLSRVELDQLVRYLCA